MKRKTKLQIVKDRSAKHKTTHFFWQDFHHEKIAFVEFNPPKDFRKEPYIKDIELFQYIHG